MTTHFEDEERALNQVFWSWGVPALAVLALSLYGLISLAMDVLAVI